MSATHAAPRAAAAQAAAVQAAATQAAPTAPLLTAIGADYAILMRERIGGSATSLLGTLLSALTTWLSFGLLAVSSTPAVSNFGLTISIGLAFSFLLAPWAADGPPRNAQP